MRLVKLSTVLVAVLFSTPGTIKFSTTADTPAPIADKPPSAQLSHFSSPNVTTSITSDVPATAADTSAAIRALLQFKVPDGVTAPTADAPMPRLGAHNPHDFEL